MGNGPRGRYKSRPEDGCDPLVPSDLRIRDVPMPFSFDSMWHIDMNSVHDHRVFSASVHLMIFAWNSKPTGALLDYDAAQFARLAHVSIQWWRRHRAEALAPFVRCSDGGYYHPDLCNEAMRFAGRRRVAEPWTLDVSPAEWVRLRAVVFERDGYRCIYCRSEQDLRCDHVIARAVGGLSALDNLVTACVKCNTSKSAKPVLEWLDAGGAT